MIDLRSIENIGTEAVKKLRLRKLSSGHPFMINSKDLQTNQCYLEYPDGVIKLVTINKSATDFDVIRELTPEEANIIRRRYNFVVE